MQITYYFGSQAVAFGYRKATKATMTKVKQSMGNCNAKLYIFKKVPKTEEKLYCLTF